MPHVATAFRFQTMSTRTTVDFNSRQVHEHSRSRIPACLGNAEESVGSRSASVGSFRVFSLLACVCALRPERRCGGDGPREGRVVISPSALPSTVKFLSALRCEELRRSVIAVGTTDTRGPRSRQNQEPMPEFKKTEDENNVVVEHRRKLLLLEVRREEGMQAV